jgi:hypothetical protein
MANEDDLDIRIGGDLLVATAHVAWARGEEPVARAQALAGIRPDADGRALARCIDALHEEARDADNALLLGFVDHPDAAVRESVGRSLQWLYEDGDEQGRLEPAVHDALVRLCGDPDAEVRDWSLWNLGSTVYGPSVTEPALAAYRAAFDDPHDGARFEARAALALSGDIDALVAYLEEYEPESEHVEVALRLADPRLLPGLESSWLEGEWDRALLDAAIAVCRAA